MVLELVGSAAESDHLLFSLRCSSWTEWPEALDLPSAHFALFLACDSGKLDQVALKTMASRIVKQGLAYFCAWGPGCELVHDAVDAAIIESRPAPSEDDAILTTWHQSESLEDALQFFLQNAEPSAAFRYNCTSWVAASIGSMDLASRIKKQLKNSLSHSDDLGTD